MTGAPARALGCALVLVAAAARAEVGYRVDVASGADRHRVAIVMTVEDAPAPLDVSMPVWTPGAYERRDWGRNVVALAARDGKGAPLRAARTGPGSWRIEGHAPGAAVTIAYEVFADLLADDTSQVDARHAMLNGTSIFLRAHGRDHVRHRVSLAAAPEARVATALDGEGRERSAPDYEALCDAPIEVGAFTAGTIAVGGRRIEVAIDAVDAPVALPPHLLGDLAAILRAEERLAGPAPFARYLFLIHLADAPEKIVALEHRASTSLVLPADALGDEYGELLYTAAHELFHAWNARLLRPAELVPVDFDAPRPAASLWITEGVTEYFALRALLVAGRVSPDEYLRRIGEEAARVWSDPTREAQTLEEQAWLTWHHPDLLDGDPDVYYARGHLVALGLDLVLRARSGGRRTLDDVVRALAAEATRRGGAVAVDTDRLGAAAAAQLDGAGAREVVECLVAWTRRPGGPDLDAELRAVGLRLEARVAPEQPWLGLGFTRDQDGALRVTVALPEGPGARAGVMAGDRITALDGVAPAVAWPGNKPLLGRARIRMEVERAGRRLALPVTPEPHREVVCRLSRVADAPPAAVHLRDALLGETTARDHR